MTQYDEDTAIDIMDAIEEGALTEEQLVQAIELAAAMRDDDLLVIDPFDGDVEQTAILSDKIISGQKDYFDHWTRRPIAKGERHRCLRERVEDGTITTTRHSLLSLWIISQSGDPSSLASEAAR